MTTLIQEEDSYKENTAQSNARRADPAEGRKEMETVGMIMERGEVAARALKSPLLLDILHPSARRPTSQDDKAKELAKTFQIIRPELNIEKHADFIFAPSHSKSLNKPRKRAWIETLPDGRQVEASLLIEPFQGKTLTTKARKVYLALHKLWEEKGWDDEERTIFSASEVTDTIGWKWHGSKSLKEIRSELRHLRGNLFIWEFSWVEENGHRVSLEQPFSILDDYRLVTKQSRNPNQLFLALSSFRFHEEIRKNLKANRTKPTNLDVVLSIKGEIASVLYAHLDIILADKDHYERTTAGLFGDLRLEGEKEYLYPSGRKRKLEKAIKELQGKPISTGVLRLSLAKTRDGKDWKLVAKKTPLKDEKQKVLTGRIVPPANPLEDISYLVQEMATTLGGLPKYHRLYEKLLKTYPYEMVYQALSEWRTDGGRGAEKPIAFFLGILHRLAHFRGKLWIKSCPPDCKYSQTA